MASLNIVHAIFCPLHSAAVFCANRPSSLRITQHPGSKKAQRLSPPILSGAHALFQRLLFDRRCVVRTMCCTDDICILEWFYSTTVRNTLSSLTRPSFVKRFRKPSCADGTFATPRLTARRNIQSLRARIPARCQAHEQTHYSSYNRQREFVLNGGGSHSSTAEKGLQRRS